MAKLTGLYWDPITGKGVIKKQIRGAKLSKRFAASTREEAEAIYYQTIANPRTTHSAAPTWREAATHYLTTETKKSLRVDSYCLSVMDAHIGHLPLDQVHQGTLQGYILARKNSGTRSGTVKRDLAVVRRILTLASRYWRLEDGRPWLNGPIPMLRMPDWHDEKKTYPLTWEEQTRLLQLLPDHLKPMVLFALNTGARESVICNLKWEWEQKIPELGRTVFLIPGHHTKNGTDCLIPVSRKVEAVLNSVRGIDQTYVFTCTDPQGHRHRLHRIHTTAWKTAWKAAGLPTTPDLCRGPHNLRHTFARRLRTNMIPHETIKTLLHHVDGDITLNYAPAQLQDLFNAVDSITEPKTLLRAVI